MMKVRLLNDGGYQSLMEVNFPVVVNADFLDEDEDNKTVWVAASDLIEAGGDCELLSLYQERRYFVDDEFEVVDE